MPLLPLVRDENGQDGRVGHQLRRPWSRRLGYAALPRHRVPIRPAGRVTGVDGPPRLPLPENQLHFRQRRLCRALSGSGAATDCGCTGVVAAAAEPLTGHRDTLACDQRPSAGGRVADVDCCADGNARPETAGLSSVREGKSHCRHRSNEDGDPQGGSTAAHYASVQLGHRPRQQQGPATGFARSRW